MIFVELIDFSISLDISIFSFNNSYCLLYFWRFILGTSFRLIRLNKIVYASEKLRCYRRWAGSLMLLLWLWVSLGERYWPLLGEWRPKLILLEGLKCLVSVMFRRSSELRFRFLFLDNSAFFSCKNFSLCSSYFADVLFYWDFESFLLSTKM